MARVVDGPQAYGSRYFYEEWAIVQVDCLLWRGLRQIDRHAEDVGVRLAKVDEAGGNEKVHEFGQAELADAVLGQLAAFIAHYCQLQRVAGFGLTDQVDHFRKWL